MIATRVCRSDGHCAYGRRGQCGPIVRGSRRYGCHGSGDSYGVDRFLFLGRVLRVHGRYQRAQGGTLLANGQASFFSDIRYFVN